MKIHALEVLLSSYSSAYTTLLSAGIDDTVVTHLKWGWYKMLSKSKISPKENVSRITALSLWIRFLSFTRNIKSTLKIKKTTDRLHTLERPKKKTIGFFTCKKLPCLIGLHTCFQHTAKPPFFFHCEWSCPMEAGAISWALPPHLGTFHISSLCAGVNDAVVADLQVLGPKLLICHVFFGTTISLHNKKQLVNTKYKQRSRAAIFCKKTNVKGFLFHTKNPAFLQHQPIQPQWIVPGEVSPVQGPTMDQTSLGLRSLSCIQMSHSSAFWGLLQGRWARGDEKIKVAICVHNV